MRARISDMTGQVLLGPFTSGPHVLWSSCPKPVIPSEARALGKAGVGVALLVGPDGSLQESRLTESSGSARQDEAVRAALSACKFAPRTVDDVPTPHAVWFTISIGNGSAWLRPGYEPLR